MNKAGPGGVVDVMVKLHLAVKNDSKVSGA